VSAPQRVRVLGDLYHGRVPAGAVYVGRPAPGLKGSRYANPFRPGHTAVNPATGREVTVVDRPHAVALYEAMLAHREATDPEWAALARRDLACWCPPAEACHCDPLLPFVNQPHFDCGHLHNPENTFVQVAKRPVGGTEKVYEYDRCRACRRTRRREKDRRRQGVAS
jgi:hypothetical protein